MATTVRRVRHQAKRSLRKSTRAARIAERLADLLVENNLDGVLAFDRQYRYTMWNAAMERLTGVSRAGVLGRTAFEVFPFLWSIGEDVYFARALAGHATEARHRPFWVPETGCEGYFDAWYIPLRDRSGTILGALGVIRNVARREKGQAP